MAERLHRGLGRDPDRRGGVRRSFCGGWALSNLFGIGLIGEYILTAAFCILGVIVMTAFVRNGMKVEPFTTRG